MQLPLYQQHHRELNARLPPINHSIQPLSPPSRFNQIAVILPKISSPWNSAIGRARARNFIESSPVSRAGGMRSGKPRTNENWSESPRTKRRRRGEARASERISSGVRKRGTRAVSSRHGITRQTFYGAVFQRSAARELGKPVRTGT